MSIPFQREPTKSGLSALGDLTSLSSSLQQALRCFGITAQQTDVQGLSDEISQTLDQLKHPSNLAPELAESIDNIRWLVTEAARLQSAGQRNVLVYAAIVENARSIAASFENDSTDTARQITAVSTARNQNDLQRGSVESEKCERANGLQKTNIPVADVGAEVSEASAQEKSRSVGIIGSLKLWSKSEPLSMSGDEDHSYDYRFKFAAANRLFRNSMPILNASMLYGESGTMVPANELVREMLKKQGMPKQQIRERIVLERFQVSIPDARNRYLKDDAVELHCSSRGGKSIAVAIPLNFRITAARAYCWGTELDAPIEASVNLFGQTTLRLPLLTSGLKLWLEPRPAALALPQEVLTSFSRGIPRWTQTRQSRLERFRSEIDAVIDVVEKANLIADYDADLVRIYGNSVRLSKFYQAAGSRYFAAVDRAGVANCLLAASTLAYQLNSFGVPAVLLSGHVPTIDQSERSHFDGRYFRQTHMQVGVPTAKGWHVLDPTLTQSKFLRVDPDGLSSAEWKERTARMQTATLAETSLVATNVRNRLTNTYFPPVTGMQLGHTFKDSRGNTPAVVRAKADLLKQVLEMPHLDRDALRYVVDKNRIEGALLEQKLSSFPGASVGWRGLNALLKYSNPGLYVDAPVVAVLGEKNPELVGRLSDLILNSSDIEILKKRFFALLYEATRSPEKETYFGILARAELRLNLGIGLKKTPVTIELAEHVAPAITKLCAVMESNGPDSAIYEAASEFRMKGSYFEKLSSKSLWFHISIAALEGSVFPPELNLEGIPVPTNDSSPFERRKSLLSWIASGKASEDYMRFDRRGQKPKPYLWNLGASSDEVIPEPDPQREAAVRARKTFTDEGDFAGLELYRPGRHDSKRILARASARTDKLMVAMLEATVSRSSHIHVDADFFGKATDARVQILVGSIAQLLKQQSQPQLSIYFRGAPVKEYRAHQLRQSIGKKLPWNTSLYKELSALADELEGAAAQVLSGADLKGISIWDAGRPPLSKRAMHYFFLSDQNADATKQALGRLADSPNVKIFSAKNDSMGSRRLMRNRSFFMTFVNRKIS